MTRSALATALAALLPTLIRADPFFYPNWSSNKCSSETNANLPTGHGWTETTIEGCCARYFGHDTAYNACIVGTGGTLEPNNKWYIDWSVFPNVCSKGCEVIADIPLSKVCGGIPSPYTTKKMYDTAEKCCAGELASNNQGQCAWLSNKETGTYPGSKKFYEGSSERLCVQDCVGDAPCGGVLTTNRPTYDTIKECCAKQLPYLDKDICETQSSALGYGTEKWFPNGGVCKKDCTGYFASKPVSTDMCEKPNAWTQTASLYDTPEACCKGSLTYLDLNYCKSRSDLNGETVPATGYTDRWYVNWDNHACSKDCTSSSDKACKKLTSNAILHPTPEACCAAHITYTDGAKCKAASIAGVKSDNKDDTTAATSTGKWFADYGTARRCVKDCPVGTGGPGCGGSIGNAVPYDDAKACCAAKFGWYQSDLCKVLSETDGTGHTNLFYPDQGEGMCHKDCVGTAGSCKGTPTDLSQEMYATAEACCAAKLSWINKDTCKTKSENGANAPNVGTNQWFVNWQTNTCDKDCKTGDGAGCRGVSDGKSVTMHPTVAACCTAHFAGINGDLCAARANGNAHTNKFYPNQGDAKCYQDCAGSTAPCKGSPTDLYVKMYDTMATCCSTSISWADAASCAGASASDLATTEWYANWELNKCVKNCPTSSGDGACGGIAEGSWNIKFASSTECCNQSAFAWKKKSECIKS